MTQDSLVRCEQEAGVATLTLNRPAAMNALNRALVDELLRRLEQVEQDPDVRAIVLTGSGRGFCAGGDVKAMGAGDERSFHQKLAHMRHLHTLPLKLAHCSKVTIAMINGAAVGAGLGLALCCDFRVMSAAAKLSAAFARVGMSSDFGVSWLLPRIAGEAKARELLLTAETLSAAEAHAAGLVTEVAAEDQLAETTRRWATRFATGPTLAYQSIKRNLAAAGSASFADLLDLEAINQVAIVDSDDHREAARAFAQKRAPTFGGS